MRTKLDENKAREHIMGLGLKLRPFAVFADDKQKMLSLVGWAETAPATLDDAPEPESKEQPSSRFYTVRSGDTLPKIAREYYGNASKYPLIFEANKPMLTSPDRI